MSFGHRRLLLFDEKSTRAVLLAKNLDYDLCFLKQDCPDGCKNESDEAVNLLCPPPPPSRNGSSHTNMPTILILMLCILGAAFVFLCYLTILKRYRSNLMSSSRRRRRDTDTAAPVGDGDGNSNGREDFMDENQWPMMINPIWYINTVGLQQSVIDSISVFKYKKGEGLIESADCSVCLSEFEEDERLRLLPKCSHAFHIDCIDMWLRSHKNCPLCRAPIVRESIPEAEEESVLMNNNNNNSGSPENTSAADDDNDNDAGVERNQPEIGVENNCSTTDSISTAGVSKRNDGFRVLSDLSDHHHYHRRVRNTGEEEEELQATVVRRSISMDAASASVIYTAVAKISPVMQEKEEEEGCSKLQESKLKKPTSDKVTKQRVGKELIIHKSRKSFSFGRTLQKMPIRMKRSFSSSSSSNSKSSLPRNNRNGRSQELIQSF